MTDLETLLRTLDGDLRSDPPVGADEIRRRGQQRRGRRHLALAGGTAAVVVLGATLAANWRAPQEQPPAGPGPSVSAPTAPTGSATPPTAGDPLWVTRVHSDPVVFAHAAGGSGLATPQITGEALVTQTGGCLVLSSTARADQAAENQPRALILPIGTRWTGNPGQVRLTLTDGRTVSADSWITADVLLSPRTNTEFSASCPGTAGYAAIVTPEAIRSIAPSPASTPSSTAKATPSADLESTPLAAGLIATGEGILAGPSRSLVSRVDAELPACLQPAMERAAAGATDALAVLLSEPAASYARSVRSYPDEAAARAALQTWRSALAACDGALVEGTPSLRLRVTLEDFDAPDRTVAIVAYQDDPTGTLYIANARISVLRVGTAVALSHSADEAQATPSAIAAWQDDEAETLTLLARGMCQFTAAGCD